MRKWIQKYWGLGVLSLMLVGCGGPPSNGPFTVNVIQPAQTSCEFQIAEGRLETLYSLETMEGALGKVVYQDKELLSDTTTLDAASGFEPVDVRFSESGSIFNPLDYASMFASSLYWSIEQAHLLFRGLDDRADMITRLGNTAETLIIQEARARISDDSPEATDNAAFLGHFYVDQNSGSVGLRNYFFSFPTDEISSIPLGINLGVMIHEYTHFVSFHLFQWDIIQRFGGFETLPIESVNTILAVDEGIADYFGFLGSGDARFLQCSLPNARRNLANPKVLTSENVSALRSDPGFDSHSVGAVLASALYQTAVQTGETETLGESLIVTLDRLAECSRSGNNSGTYTYNLGVFRRCHLQNLTGNLRDTMDNFYQRSFGGFY